MTCLASLKYRLTADVLGQAPEGATAQPGYSNVEQDPETGQIIRRWESDHDAAVGIQNRSIDCMVKGIDTSGGQKFGKTYSDDVDAYMTFDPKDIVTKGDQITNIKDSRGNLAFVEYLDGQPRTIVFDVILILPRFDPFGAHVENYAELTRASRQ